MQGEKQCNNAWEKGVKESVKEIHSQLFSLGLVTMATEAFLAECGTNTEQDSMQSMHKIKLWHGNNRMLSQTT